MYGEVQRLRSIPAIDCTLAPAYRVLMQGYVQLCMRAYMTVQMLQSNVIICSMSMHCDLIAESAIRHLCSPLLVLERRAAPGAAAVPSAAI